MQYTGKRFSFVATAIVLQNILHSIQVILPVVVLPFIAFYIAGNYGNFIWGEFYRQFFWLLCSVYILQLGSRQMLAASMATDDVEDEFKTGFQSRIFLLICICLLLFFLPITFHKAATFSLFLLLRFTGDALIALQRVAGRNKQALFAESMFWILFISGILFFRDSVSSQLLFQIATAASLLRMIVADPRLLQSIYSGTSHAPDLQWLKEATRKFIAQFSHFLFQTSDLILASFILTTPEFASYQITLLSIYSLILLISTFLKPGKYVENSVVYKLIIRSSLALPIVLFVMRLLITDIAKISISPWYLIAGFLIILSGSLATYFGQRLVANRELRFIQFVYFGTAAFHCIVLPFLLKGDNLMPVLWYHAIVQCCVLLLFKVRTYQLAL